MTSSDVNLMAENQSECSHTPGPWGIEMHGNWLFVAIPHAVGRKILARIETGFNEPFESQQHANARLIAAGPDLLALAKQYASECSECGGTGMDPLGLLGCLDCEDIRAVIAKAEGRS